eukprot:s457_g5.t2
MRLFGRASESRIHSRVCWGLWRRSGCIAAGCHAMSRDRAVSILPAVDGIVYCRRKLVRSRVEKPGASEALHATDVEKRRHDRQLKQFRYMLQQLLFGCDAGQSDDAWCN